MKTVTNTVVGLLKNRDEAQFAAWDLVNCGFQRDEICIRTTEVERHFWGDEGETVVVKGSAQRIPDDEGSRAFAYETQVPMGPGDLPALTELGIPEADARFFCERMRRGGFLVTVSTVASRAEEAAEILRRHGAIDREERPGTWREEDFAGFDAWPATAAETPARPAAPANEPLSRATLEQQLQRAGVFGEAEGEPGEEARRQPDISAMDDEEFQRHFRAIYGKMGERFDEPYRSAYRFAEAESASHPQFANKHWYEVEEDIHRDWEQTHPGTWNRVEDAIHFGWSIARRR